MHTYIEFHFESNRMPSTFNTAKYAKSFVRTRIDGQAPVNCSLRQTVKSV